MSLVGDTGPLAVTLSYECEVGAESVVVRQMHVAFRACSGRRLFWRGHISLLLKYLVGAHGA